MGIYTTEINGNMERSMVPPEWHRWLYRMTDESPATKLPTACKFI